MRKKIILAYSGGLDTSALIPWLKENQEADVVAYCCDVGNQPDPQWLRERALYLGACDFIFEDLREKFVNDFVYPMVRAGATYQQDYLLGTAIARPLIAERIAEYARREKATAIAHGATGKGNDHLRFERTWAYLLPNVQVIAPWKEWAFKSRRELKAYLDEKGFKLDLGVAGKYSVDSNLYHCSTEGSVLEDVDREYDPKDVLKWTDLAECAQCPESSFTIQFRKGLPVEFNGKSVEAEALLSQLNALGQKHGVGIVDLVEERANGIKSRGVYETPGGYLLHFATKQLKQICWGKELFRVASGLAAEYGQLIYDGQWHSTSRTAIEAFFARASENLTGEVGVKIVGSNLFVTRRRSPHSLYNAKHVSFEEDGLGFNQASAHYTLFATYPNKMAGFANEGRG